MQVAMNIRIDKMSRLKRILKVLINVLFLSGFIYVGEIALRYISEDYGDYVKEKTWSKRLNEAQQIEINSEKY